MEIWKEIKGYEGRYEVSNFGRVRSMSHLTPSKGGRMRLSPGKILALRYANNGRPKVHLSKPGLCKWHSVHRLVAFAFCDGYFEGAQVNHIDENPANNRADNLEWCTASYNTSYGHRNDTMINQRKKAVNQYTIGGTFIKTFSILNLAARETGISAAHICDVCKGKRNTAGGFIWKYSQEAEQ